MKLLYTFYVIIFIYGSAIAQKVNKDFNSFPINEKTKIYYSEDFKISNKDSADYYRELVFKDKNIHFNTLALGSVQTKMLEKAFPGFNALTSAKKMANYIFEFSTDGYKLFNGKIIPVSSSTP